MKKVAVIGGGVTGLAAAHRLTELSPDTEVILFESSDRLGGVLHTESIDNYLVEHSADMFTTKDVAALELCQRIGLADELINTNNQFQKAFIAQGTQLVPVPKGLNLMTPSDLNSIQETSLLSEDGKKRFLHEEHIEPKCDGSDESLKSFASRRFGPEAFDKIVQPLVGGIYTADPAKLSMKATLPQYLEMEAKYGSVIGAVKSSLSETKASHDQATSGARYHLFVAPRHGMASLINAIQNNLGRTQVRLNCTVTSLSKTSTESWQVVVDGDQPMEVDGIILTSPTDKAAEMISTSCGDLSRLLSSIDFASSAIVVNGFEKKQIGHHLKGFGFVVPLSENRRILAGSFSSVKFDGRSNDDKLLTRSFVGGGCQPELLEHDDNKIAAMANEDLTELLQINGEPEFTKVIRWTRSMPQYHLGHTNLVSDIESAITQIERFEIAGKCFRGVGIPACIASGERSAERLLGQ